MGNGPATPGNSYRDPGYGSVERRLEKKYGLPSGIMSNIRTRGERSNADQVSEAGARSVYQIIPSTRDGFLKKYGVDAYASPEAAAEVAALHLRESFRRGGDWNQAVAEYHGGTDRRNWGPKTRAYVGRAGKGVSPVAENGAVATDPGFDINSISTDDLLTTSPSELGNTRRPLGPERKDPRLSEPANKQRHLDALTGGRGLHTGAAPDTASDVSAEAAIEKAGVAAQADKDQYGFTDRLTASWHDWLPWQMVEAMQQEVSEPDPGFTSFYMKNWDHIESFAQSDDEVEQLRAANSVQDLAAIQDRITATRKNDFVIDSNGTGTGFRIMAGLADPGGWVLGAGVGKAFQLAGMGSRALMAAGKTGKAVLSLGAESALGNLAFTAGLDAAGVDQDSDDYLMSGASGLAIGFALSPIVLRGAGNPMQTATEAANVARREREAVMAEARVRAGDNATPEQVQAEATRIDTEQKRSWLHMSLADVGDEFKLLSSDPEQLLTADADVLARVSQEGNLAAISDDAERAMVAEHLARAQQMLAANPIDKKALNTSLKLAGMESTGLRLLASESPVARAVGMTLLEGTTGAGGRRRTAAMAQAVRERIYNRHMTEYDSLYHQFRKGQGKGLVMEAWDGTARREFNSQVFAELEARADTPAGKTFADNPAVVRAADLFERGMTAMRVEQQHVGTVGYARLGATSRGYVPHRLDPAKVLKLTASQQAKLRAVLTEQFVDPQNGFDQAFSQKLATKYLERAIERAKGAYDVPFNLHSPDAADIVRDTLEALHLPGEELEKLMGKFARGGAGHTKRRLRIQMDKDIGEGMKMQDLFVTDVPNLFRGYARRVSGEVALAQYGIMGKKGLNVLRKSLETTGASADDMHAFDQIAAEFLNTPYGSHNHKYMDNIRIATSLARLGGMGFTQMAEYGNGLAALGVTRTFAAIGALPRLRNEVKALKRGAGASNPILHSLDTLGGHIGLDDYNLTRLFDVKDNDIQMYSSERLGVFTRSLRAAGNFQAMVSGHRVITAVQTRGMAEQIIHKAVRFIKAGKEDKALLDMGFTPELQASIRANLADIAEFDAKGNLTQLDVLKGKLTGNEVATLRDAVERGASQIIQRTYTGETGKWAHDGFLKMLLQFRTFSLISVEKQWGRSRNNYGAMRAAMMLFGAMSFAVPIHLARTQLKALAMPDDKRKEFLDKSLSPLALGRSTLSYASASGLLGDIIDVGGGFAVDFGMVDPDQTPFVGARGQGRGNLLGGTIAPGVGLVEDLWDGAHGNTRKLAKSLPGGNLPYVQPFIAGLQQSAD